MMTSQGKQVRNKIIQFIPPVGEYEGFRDQEHYKQKLKDWGLSIAKEEFWYKERDLQELVAIKGYQIYGKTDEFNSVVIDFKDGNLTCIHPAYLKEMQQSSFGKESMWEEGHENGREFSKKEAPVQIKAPETKAVEKKKSEPKSSKKEKAVKIELPTEKVHFSASVKQFAMTYNSFTEENDEVIIFENIQIYQEPPINLEYAWCSHSKTLKKLELAIGDRLEFDGKITTKKLTKGKDAPEEFNFSNTVLYKINNPSKLVKQ
jgi:hypothetical protein